MTVAATRTTRWMIYGAYGYTGWLTAEVALARGQAPILAGRDEARVREVAARFALEHRAFGLDDAGVLDGMLRDVDAVVHCAGPFSATSRPMVDACLRTGTHYLDITGEIDVFEAVFSRDEEARAAGVALMPGVGFDVVPTDCLAAKLRAALPSATRLELAFAGLNAPSAGTAQTMVEGLPRGGRARIEGKITKVPTVWKTRQVPFFDRERLCVSIPWGDVSTAFYSTGIPNITAYMAVPSRHIKVMRALERMKPALGLAPVQRLLKRAVQWRVKGPSDDQRAGFGSQVWGEVRNPRGEAVSGVLTTPDGYTLTADSAVRAVTKLLASDLRGALTPSMAFGADYIDELDGVTVAPLRR